MTIYSTITAAVSLWFVILFLPFSLLPQAPSWFAFLSLPTFLANSSLVTFGAKNKDSNFLSSRITRGLNITERFWGSWKDASANCRWECWSGSWDSAAAFVVCLRLCLLLMPIRPFLLQAFFSSEGDAGDCCKDCCLLLVKRSLTACHWDQSSPSPPIEIDISHHTVTFFSARRDSRRCDRLSERRGERRNSDSETIAKSWEILPVRSSGSGILFAISRAGASQSQQHSMGYSRLLSTKSIYRGSNAQVIDNSYLSLQMVYTSACKKG